MDLFLTTASDVMGWLLASGAADLPTSGQGGFKRHTPSVLHSASIATSCAAYIECKHLCIHFNQGYAVLDDACCGGQCMLSWLC